MSLRQLVVLGTASQVPTRYRNHNGYLLLWDGRGVLFDPGEGTQRQMTLAGVTATQIHRICVTHFHGDHCLGLPGVLQRISLDEVPHPVHVHFPGSGRVFFDRLRRASIYDDRADVRPVPHEVEGVIAEGDPTFSTARLDHPAPAWGYRLAEQDTWTVDAQAVARTGLRGAEVGRLKREGEATAPDGQVVRLADVATPRAGQKVAFLMDTKPCDAAVRLAEGVDLLICESTFLDADRKEAHAYGHMTAGDAGRLAKEAGARRLVLTHFSQRYPMDAPFVEQARRHHDDVVAAVDLLRIDVPPRRGG